MKKKHFVVSLGGSRIAIDGVGDGRLLVRRLRELYGPFVASGRRHAARVEIIRRNGEGEVRVDGRRVGRSRSDAGLCAIAEWAATRAALREIGKSAFPLHAAWVARKARGILIVGAHGAGKSLLSAALHLRFGWRILSDDVVVLTRTARIRALGRPLRLKSGARSAEPRLPRVPGNSRRGGWPELVSLGRFGSRRAAAPRTQAVVFLGKHGREGARLRALGQGISVAKLLRHTGGTRERPEQSLEAAARLVRSVTNWTLDGGCLPERCLALERVLEAARNR